MTGLSTAPRRCRPPMRNTWPRWACLSLCYLAFAGSLSKGEGVAAVLTGAFTAALSIGLRAQGEPRLSLSGRWTAVLAHEALQLVRDTARVARTLAGLLLRQRGYRGRVQREAASAEQSPGAGAGRRAVTALLVSLTPDSVALEPGDAVLPVHRLSRASHRVRGRPRRA
jgi:hypothetical protein